MPHAIAINGVNGQIKWGYVQAAVVDSWSLAVDATGGELTGVVSSPPNEFAVAQPALRFVVPRQQVTWEWPIESLQMTDGRLHARLGRKKE